MTMSAAPEFASLGRAPEELARLGVDLQTIIIIVVIVVIVLAVLGYFGRGRRA